MPKMKLINGRIQIINLPKFIMQTAMSMGDVNLFGKYYPPTRDNGLKIGITTGQEEGLHTIQSRIVGPLYFPLHLMAGIRSIFTSPNSARFPWADPWHRNNFMETGPMQGNVFKDPKLR